VPGEEHGAAIEREARFDRGDFAFRRPGNKKKDDETRRLHRGQGLKSEV